MGYMVHHAIIVTGSDYKDAVTKAHAIAEGVFGESVTPIVASINGYRSFMVAPDGSKEGWDESAAGDLRRREFVDYLKKQRHGDLSSPLDWVVVQYGDDNGDTRIVDDSDAVGRRDELRGIMKHWPEP